MLTSLTDAAGPTDDVAWREDSLGEIGRGDEDAAIGLAEYPAAGPSDEINGYSSGFAVAPLFA